MTLSNVHLDSHLVADMLRHPVPTPPLHPRNIRLRQTLHSPSVATRPVATFTGIRPRPGGANSGCHSHTGTLAGNYHPTGEGKFFFTMNRPGKSGDFLP